MNIYVELNKIIEYTENHLEEKIDTKKLAKKIGVSEYTFLKIFAILSNVTFAEYVRNRRLSNAGQELFLKHEKIVDVAVKYQYNNATSFSRAFEKFHGIKPSQVKNAHEKLKIYTKLHFNENYENNKEIEYEIIEKEQMVLYGNSKKTTNENIKKDAPKLFQENYKLYGFPQYGLVEYKDKERYKVKEYWILYNKKQGNMKKKIIPKSKWIQIKINNQETKDIQQASDMFYKEFLPNCKYNFRDLPEIEFYHDGITDFLIPIEG